MDTLLNRFIHRCYQNDGSGKRKGNARSVVVSSGCKPQVDSVIILAYSFLVTIYNQPGLGVCLFIGHTIVG